MNIASHNICFDDLFVAFDYIQLYQQQSYIIYVSLWFIVVDPIAGPDKKSDFIPQSIV